MKVFVIMFLFLSLVGCSGEVPEDQSLMPNETIDTGNNIMLVPVEPDEPEEADSYPEASEGYAEYADGSIDYDVEVNDMDDIIETIGNDDFAILDILGTAGSIYGTRWESMLAWRENAALLAKQYREVVFLNMNPDDNAVYLTFDDGPDPINTVSVINTLIEYGVSATFFFTGENMRRHSDVVQMTHDAGFAIGLHSYSHPHFTNLSEAEIIEELNVPNDILESIIGRRSNIMRPPFGSATNREIEIIREQGYLVYLWSLDTLDWALDNADDILQNIKDFLRPGDIILMHAFSGQARSASILPEIIEFIKSMGLEMKALPGM